MDRNTLVVIMERYRFVVTHVVVMDRYTHGPIKLRYTNLDIIDRNSPVVIVEKMHMWL